MSDDQPANPVLGGRFELRRRIARGGMSDVFLAHDQVLDRRVAVKMLSARLADNPRFVTRFRREASAVAKLNHPNIVQIYDWGAHEDTYFIVMEHVEGESLAQILARGRLEVHQVIAIAAGAAAGLGYAHRNGIVHRDIKPGNLLLAPSHDIKVTDFGIAQAVESDDKLTDTGMIMGTAAYFAPEQAQGHEVGPPSDLYSLGVVLFETLTGRPPFEGTPMSVAYQHVNDRPPRIQAHDPSLPADLGDLIDRLLAKSPDHRYPSASELEADLERLARGEPLYLGTQSSSAQAAPSPAGHSSAAPAFDQALAPATAAMPTSVRPDYGPDEPDVRLAPPPGRGGVFTFVVAAVLVAAVVVAIFYLASLLGQTAGETPAGDSGEESPTTTGEPVPTTEPTSTEPTDATTESTEPSSTEPESTTTTAPTTTTTEPATTTTPTTSETTATTASSTTGSGDGDNGEDGEDGDG